MWSFLAVAAGLVVIIKAADYLVQGASSISLSFRISPLVVGLTIVAFGTSAPELFISLVSAFEGNTQIALSNAIGSNIANTLLILGASALIYPLKLHKKTLKELPMSVFSAFLLLWIGILALNLGSIINIPLTRNSIVGEISTQGGLIFLASFVIFLFYSFQQAKRRKGEHKSAAIPKKISRKKAFQQVIIGTIALAAGAKITVDGVESLAMTFGVSDALVSLTVLAIGTSLPELVTSITAALKKSTDIAVGNILGSNVFNIFFVLGATALVAPIEITGQDYTDIIFLAISSLIILGVILFYKRDKITRAEGAILTATYIGYIAFIIARG